MLLNGSTSLLRQPRGWFRSIAGACFFEKTNSQRQRLAQINLFHFSWNIRNAWQPQNRSHSFTLEPFDKLPDAFLEGRAGQHFLVHTVLNMLRLVKVYLVVICKIFFADRAKKCWRFRLKLNVVGSTIVERLDVA